jgi:hypothetical protein
MSISSLDGSRQAVAVANVYDLDAGVHGAVPVVPTPARWTRCARDPHRFVGRRPGEGGYPPAVHWDWGDVPTWVGGGAGVGALIAAVLAYRNLREQARLLTKANDKQDQELKAVQKDREREAEERRRAQAAQVFMTYDFGDRARKMIDFE